MNSVEHARYFEVPGAHLYTVLHEVSDPLGRVLLVGPCAWERNPSYVPWVRWARFLASRGIECLRFDYRGIGESTGVFAEMSFDDWVEDIELLAAWMRGRSPEAPLVLHGLELGSLLAGKAFAADIGDALLMWAAPNSAQEILKAALLRRVAVDNMFRYGDERKQPADYIQKLEREPVEIEGYHWSSRLWHDSFQLKVMGMDKVGSGAGEHNRPFKMVPIGKSAEPLVKGSTYISINPNLEELFTDNVAWIFDACEIQRRGQRWFQPFEQGN